jgi:hypothetical protein
LYAYLQVGNAKYMKKDAFKNSVWNRVIDEYSAAS